MEVLDKSSAMVSNYEVLSLLQEKMQKELNKKPSKKIRQENLATISYEVVKYLEKTPCCLQNEAVITQFLKDVAPFNLTKGEKLQMLNLRPTTPVEIQLIVEESEERLRTDEELQALIDIIAKLPENYNNKDIKIEEES
ncbi:DNA-directed RNA polymerase III subunit RPC9-like [Xenia sp. Carnegie-2017]|uniref:DNA-directed RNA polymerase III subunit RPC9-like n=1 Tax=Xenia sp. Carnegie-2017 TaxID=2897299 RepID=UPI001F0389E7|nr:DNA-directed RNA polymerase III subunit RPC9-like [Xenia sp. Carnegie-2017]